MQSRLQDNAWKVELKTLSRDGAIKVSAILAAAIASDRLLSQKTRVFILGGAGKSLIVDAMARTISDHHKPYKMPPNRFVEGKPDAALGRRYSRQLVKPLTHGGQSLVTTFQHLGGEARLSWWNDILCNAFRSRNVGIDFMTEINQGFNETFFPDISIRFYPDHDNELEKGWGRKWTIEIENPELHTEEMRQAIDQIAGYEKRREKKVAKIFT